MRFQAKGPKMAQGSKAPVKVQSAAWRSLEGAARTPNLAAAFPQPWHPGGRCIPWYFLQTARCLPQLLGWLGTGLLGLGYSLARRTSGRMGFDSNPKTRCRAQVKCSPCHTAPCMELGTLRHRKILVQRRPYIDHSCEYRSSATDTVLG